MSVTISVRHDKVQSNVPIESTYDFLNMVISVGETCNTGFNVLITSDLYESLEKQKKEQKKEIELRDESFSMIVKDLMRINFTLLGIGGVSIAKYVADIKKVSDQLTLSRVMEGKKE